MNQMSYDNVGRTVQMCVQLQNMFGKGRCGNKHALQSFRQQYVLQ